MLAVWSRGYRFSKIVLCMRISALLCAALLAAGVARAQEEHPTLAIGAQAPEFSLPGIDGKTHTLDEYKAAKVLVIVFTCDNCPTAHLYETRLKKLVDEYKPKGVAFVAIQPNDPDAVRLDELGYT